MDTLLVSNAVTLVRRNLDELEQNASVMYTDEASDNASLDNTIKRLLPDAINAVHKIAPAALLEGESVPSQDIVNPTYDDGVLSFEVASGDKLLRLVAFRLSDSPIVLTDILAEASPEGRKQLNKHIRGQYDRPRLVRLQGVTTKKDNTNPTYKYYSLKNDIVPTALEDYPAGEYLEHDEITIFSFDFRGPDDSLVGTQADCSVVTIGATPFWFIPFEDKDIRAGEITIGGDEISAPVDASHRTFIVKNGTAFEQIPFGQVQWMQTEKSISEFLIIKELSYNDTTPATNYPISGLLRSNIIDYLTALTLEAFADQRAQTYYTKALAF